MEEENYKNSDSIAYLLQAKLSFMLRYGMTFMLALGILVLVLLYFVKVPDTLEGKFVLTSNNPPKPMVSKINGRVTTKIIEDKSQVKKGQILVIMENLANINEIEKLTLELQKTQFLIVSNLLDSITRIDIYSLNQLGELQSPYEAFKKANNELYLAVSDRQYTQQKSIITGRLASLQKIHGNILAQKNLNFKEYQLAYENFEMDSVLVINKHITANEFRASETGYLRAEQALNIAENSLLNNESSQNDIKEQLLGLERNFEAQKNNFLQNYYGLIAALNDWKSKFLITAPFAGQVSFNRNIYEGLQVQAGEALLFISPSNSVLVCEIMVPQINFGKLKKDQRCIIKFDSYNFEEYGVLDAYVFNISDIPMEIKTQTGNENVYMIQVAFKNKLETSYHKKIEPRYGLTGLANIILEDKSLLEKLFLDKFKALFVYQ
jgi:multidrug resistance efflux pump